MTRPSTYLNWTDGASSKVIQPPAAFLLQGWQEEQAPPAEYTNWQIWLIDQWIQYLDQITVGGTPDQVLRLLNGGYWSFDATSGILAWSSAFNISIPGVDDSSNQAAAGSVTIADGDVAYVELNAPLMTTGATTSGDDHITNLAFVQGITAGMAVTGSGIPSGTTVTAVGTNSVTISAACTSTQASASFTFIATTALSVQVATAETFSASVSTILIAKRSGPQVTVGINTGQMLLRDKEFKPLLGSGYFTVYNATAGQALTAGQVVYISPGSADGGRTAGAAYPLDCSSTGSPTRATFAGVVVSTVASGGSALILFNGFFSETSLSPGSVYYADPTTPGGITATQPTGAGDQIVTVGFAVTATSLLVSSSPQNGGSLSVPVYYQDLQTSVPGQTDFILTNIPLNTLATYVFVDGLIVPSSKWTLVAPQTIRFSTAFTAVQDVQFDYVLAGQSYVTRLQETPTPAGDGVTFNLGGSPINQVATMVWVDGLVVPNSKYTLNYVSGHGQIVFPSAIPISSDVYVGYDSPVGASSSSGISGGANEGSGIGVFDLVLGSTMKFRSIKAGTGVTITNDGMGNILISQTASGGQPPAIYGSIASPQTFDPTVGLTPGPEATQIWFLQTQSGGVPNGIQTVTANPQIAAGTSVGQRLILRGVDDANYFILQGNAFSTVNGLSLNGSCELHNNQSLDLYWDGVQWYEDGRRN